MAGDLRLPEAAGRDAQIWGHRPWLRPPGAYAAHLVVLQTRTRKAASGTSVKP